MVQLFEKGYGKDAAGIAMEAIAFGTVCGECGGFGHFSLKFVERVRLAPL
jgi:hypothetical protein